MRRFVALVVVALLAGFAGTMLALPPEPEPARRRRERCWRE